jgi:hypothetical protein
LSGAALGGTSGDGEALRIGRTRTVYGSAKGELYGLTRFTVGDDLFVALLCGAELAEPADANSGVERATAPTMLRAMVALMTKDFIGPNVVLEGKKAL